MARGKKWYVLAVDPGCDKAVGKEIKKLKRKNGLEKKIGRVVIPRHLVHVEVAGRMVLQRRMMFPGYLLIHCAFTEDVFHLIAEVRKQGAVGLLMEPANPLALNSKEAAACLIRDKLEQDTIQRQLYLDRPSPPPVINCKYKIGEKVRVMEGAWAGFEGEIKDIRESTVVSVEIVLMGRQTRVPLSTTYLESIK